jgi:hypothetical protein
MEGKVGGGVLSSHVRIKNENFARWQSLTSVTPVFLDALLGGERKKCRGDIQQRTLDEELL